MLAGMRERMVQHRVRDASLVVCARKSQPRIGTPGELVDRRSHHRSSQPGRSRQNSLPSGSRKTANASPSKTSRARAAPAASVAATAASKSTVAKSRFKRFLTVLGSGTRMKSSRGQPSTRTIASPSSSYSISPPTTPCHHSASAPGSAQSKTTHASPAIDPIPTGGVRSAADVGAGAGEVEPDEYPLLLLHRSSVVVPVRMLAGNRAVVVDQAVHRLGQRHDRHRALDLDEAAVELVREHAQPRSWIASYVLHLDRRLTARDDDPPMVVDAAADG